LGIIEDNQMSESLSQSKFRSKNLLVIKA